MGKILVTGITGNVGREVAESLKKDNVQMVCGVRNVEKAQKQFQGEYEFVTLDFVNRETFDQALEGVDRVFLNYPPETPFNDFHAFIYKSKEKGVRHLTYLSVKDVQFLPFVPHHKNEKVIVQSGIPFTFLRAGYFTQNLNMFLLDELVKHDRIYVPCGKGKTSFIDLRDIAEVAAMTLLNPNKNQNKKYVLTGNKALDFYEVADIMTRVLGRKIFYSNPSLKEFKTYMMQKGYEAKYVNLVGGLHTFTKLGMAKGIKPDFTQITGRIPRTVEAYVHDYKAVWDKVVF
ncbi:NAD(P)-dependent oxidoreductase [Paenibacillus pectinilyticus]|uniref:NAD(P)-dependent oxidoreductase n=1 Tax=Paenibacillus pectinilyticus TaxID=512399 RepID=A0A1C1A1J6_9BACL|nr:SDR family oxidoreductase [Paenibacillus pectinilyticus]OCT14393.1 NAD(P)-dependent oxidoreductase [Paenibacillus pectinilyticus]